ncbi:MAG: hypothetical protein CMJ83_13000 [Planctomycetes bacterium]|nr:hypothetical protein [Planctomycetota bacterium]
MRDLGLVFVVLFAVASDAAAQDWPTYAHDMARTASTPAPLARALVPAWTWTSDIPPQPAWGGPAKWDAYSKIHDLKPRLGFDAAFHPAIVDGRVYFGSSSDDQLHCLDAKTGKELWSAFADAPIRVGPTVVRGRVLFGSDDGRVYCVAARTGKVHWTRQLAPDDRRIVGNGRMVSVWPVRTGVGTFGELAYACAGLFPAEGSYLCALRIADGSIVWRQQFQDLPPQGPILVSSTRLYVPTGRGNPVVFERKTGKKLFNVGGRGGTYALLTGDVLVSGPGKTGQLTVHPQAADTLATFQGNRMIVRRETSWLLADAELSALDRTRYLALAKERRDLGGTQRGLKNRLKNLGKPDKKGQKPDPAKVAVEKKKIRRDLLKVGSRIDAAGKEMAACQRWKVGSEHPLSMALAKDVLVCGGIGEVVLRDAGRGSVLGTLPVVGKAYGIAIADGRLFVSTDQGHVHCFVAKGAKR